MTTAMVGYDEWGLTQIPTSAGIPFTPLATNPITHASLWILPASVPVPDPCIGLILDFLATWLNTDEMATAAWAPLAGAAGAVPVLRVFAHDPEDVVFDEKHLPALYLWRDSATHSYRGDDWEDDTTELKMLWVYPLAQQSNQRVRQPYANVITKLIDAGIERGRTPSWVQPGDTDPNASTLGSLFWIFAGFDRLFFKSWTKGKLRIIAADKSDTLDYPAIEMTLELVENDVYGLDRYEALLGATLAVNNKLTGVTVVSGPLEDDSDGDMVVEFPMFLATVSSQTVIPPAALITRVYVQVLTPYTSGATLDLGNGQVQTALVNHASSPVNLQAAALYDIPLNVVWNVLAPGLPVLATLGGTTPTVGQANIVVQYSSTPGD